VDGRPRQIDIEVEVRDEPVAQILGGEIVQRCPGHDSCDRDDVMSLVVDFLHELRQRRPVSLSEESLVELFSQRRPPLPRLDLSGPCHLLFTSLTPCSALVAAGRGSLFQSLT
jgi:hypothetical protein